MKGGQREVNRDRGKEMKQIEVNSTFNTTSPDESGRF